MLRLLLLKKGNECCRCIGAHFECRERTQWIDCDRRKVRMLVPLRVLEQKNCASCLHKTKRTLYEIVIISWQRERVHVLVLSIHLLRSGVVCGTHCLAAPLTAATEIRASHLSASQFVCLPAKLSIVCYIRELFILVFDIRLEHYLVISFSTSE